MSGWNTIPPERRQTAERVCTPKQLEALQLKIDGHSWKTIAAKLHITEPAARDRYQAALDRLNTHYRKERTK